MVHDKWNGVHVFKLRQFFPHVLKHVKHMLLGAEEKEPLLHREVVLDLLNVLPQDDSVQSLDETRI